MITCLIDTFPVDFLIDSGSTINTITEDIWKSIRRAGVRVFKKRQQYDQSFTAYASHEPLRVLSVFEARVSVSPSKPETFAEFFVVHGASKSLLSKRTAEELKVLKVGLDVMHIDVVHDPFPKFPNIQVKLSINPNILPKKISYLRIPVPMEKLVDDKIQEMLRTDIIELAVGPPEWISPMVVVPKGQNDIRLCIDMRRPNEAIQREHYPLPVIDTFLNKLRGCTVFTRLDITSAFHHVELHPDSRGVTTFMTGRGLMRFKRLMFGINCAPEIFQRIMTEMLAGIEGVIVYIDDIVVAGKTKSEHDARLAEVMTVLQANNVLLNKDKCLFGETELDILGFKVSALGISPSEEKVSAIKNFRKPETKEEVRSFLGLVNFVGHFIPNLSSRTEALRQYIRGDVESFSEEQERAFDDLRSELTSNVRRLGFFDPNDVTELYVDASPVGLGAVLVQKDSSNTPRIISFASKGLTSAERIYPQTQREALAVVWAVEKFYLYLFGLRFIIYTDHKTLEYIFEGKHRDGKRACSRAESWALRLQPYTFKMKYVPGSRNISDILSRLCTESSSPFDEGSQHFLFAVGEGPSAITLDEIRNETGTDETLSAVIKALDTGEWPTNLFRYQAFCNELGVIDGVVVRNDRIVVPVQLRPKSLEIAHRGHPGAVTMRRILRERVWWPCMDRDAADRIQSCIGCTAVSRQSPPEPMIRKEIPDRAWQDIAIDFFSAKECATFLVVVDYFSRFLKVIEMRHTNAAKTIEALEQIFNEQAYPETIRCDNGPPFSGEEFAVYCKTKNIRLIRTIPYWPQMNGLVERQNQGILRALRIAKATHSDWRKALKEYVYMYNTSPHSITEKAPLELLTGRPVKDLLPSLRTEPALRQEEGVKDTDAIKKMRGKIYADNRRHAKASDIVVGDSVMLKNNETGKLEPSFRVERFTVVRKTGNDVIVANESGVTYRRSVTHLRKWPKGNGTPDPIPSSSKHPVTSPTESPSQKKLQMEQKDASQPEDDYPRPLERPSRIRKMPSRYNL